MSRCKLGLVMEDDNFRENVKRLRLAKGISQTDFARRLSGLGFPFHQQTVQRVEAGDRPVRLGEAYAIAKVLGVELPEMVSDDASTSIEAQMRDVQEALEALYAAADAYEARLFKVATEADALLEREGRDVGLEVTKPEWVPEVMLWLNLGNPYPRPPESPGPHVQRFIDARQFREGDSPAMNWPWLRND